MRLTTFVFAALGLAAAVNGQNLAVFPSELQNAEGGSSDAYFPFGSGISRTQAVLETWALNIPNGRTINQIRFRQNEGNTSTGRMLQLAVYMGGTSRTAATATGDFAANYTGTPRTLVYGPAVFSLPGLTATQAPWGQVTLPLTTPYVYNASENLVVEFVITANNNANNSFVYYLDAGYYNSATTTFGTGCLSSANTIPQLSATGGYYGSSVSFNLSQAPSNTTVYLNLNVSPSTPLLGDPFGAPGCTLLVQPLAGVLGTASGGYLTHYQQIPNDRHYYGLNIYAQAMIFDLFANPLGFAASNGAQVTVGGLPPMAKIVAAGATTATGGITRSSGPVFVFQHN